MFSTAVGRAALASALIISAVTGCRRDDPTSPAAALFGEPFFIRGPITQLGAPWGNLVTGEPGTNYQVDRAYFRTSAETEFRRADGSAATGADLRVGGKITLWITGPIMESYPVQVLASRIVIE